MGDLVDRIRRHYIAAGLEPDDALTLLMVSSAETQEEAARILEDAARKIAAGARGICPEAEKVLINRAGKDSAVAMGARDSARLPQDRAGQCHDRSRRKRRCVLGRNTPR